MLHSKMTKMDYVIEAVLIVIGAIVCICILYPILNILAISISAEDVYKRQGWITAEGH